MCDRSIDRFAAVRDEVKLRSGFSYTDFDLGDYLQRIFRSRIVRSYKNNIAVLAGDATHRHALRSIAITATSENCNDPALRQIASRLQCVQQCVVCVCVIDNDREVTFMRHTLESSWCSDTLRQTDDDRVEIIAKLESRRRRREHV